MNTSAALYACKLTLFIFKAYLTSAAGGIGPNKVPSTVEPAKQVFAFIPVRAEAKVEVSAGVKEVRTHVYECFLEAPSKG